MASPSRYEVEVKVASAKDLKNISWKHGPLRPYAVLWIDPASKCSTKADVDNDDDPIWDQTLTVPLPSHIPIEDATLSIDIVHADAEEGVKPLIGSARLRLQEVFGDVGIGGRATETLKLKRPSGRPHGKLNIEICIHDPSRFYGGNSPPSYGAPYRYGLPPTSGYPYQQSGYNYGYNAPPQPGYSYQSGGYPPEPEKKGKMGMGAGLAIGAAAGLLGGVAIAEGLDYVEDEIAEEAAEKVEEDLGYDDF